MFMACPVGMLVLSLGAAGPLGVTPVASRDAVSSQLASGAAQVTYSASGVVKGVNGEMGTLGAGTPGAVAFVRARAAVLGLRADEELVVLEDVRDPAGNRHVRLGRRVAGVAVEFDQIRVHARPDGTAYALEADLSNLKGYRHLGPTVLPGRAVEYARDGYRGPLSQETATTPVLLGDTAGITGARLAWRVRIAHDRKGTIPRVTDVYVDARTGAVLKTLWRIYADGAPATMTSQDILGQNVTLNVAQFSNGVLLKDIVTLPSNGEVTTVDSSREGAAYTTSSTSTPFSDRTAVSGASIIKKGLEYYASAYGWQNWNFATTPAGAGGMLFTLVHHGNQLNNAYFGTATNNGQTFGLMYFGDGDGQQFRELVRCEDVAVHELGHGVVTGTANLAYQFQSGALNEHVADVFGWLMDQEDDLIGEDCMGPLLLPALRDMCNPGNVPVPQPSHMSQYVELPNTEEGDHGGVHANSGIPNKAACQARAVMGATNVGRVWFQTVRFHLGANSSFADMVQGTSTSCSELSLSSSDCEGLAAAWQSVGLAAAAGGGACPPNSSMQNGQCFCNSGFRTNAEGTGCEAEASVQCPANSHAVDGQCYCDSGYAPNAAGTACVVETQASCSSNAHRQGGVCVCDECFQGNPEGNGNGCSAIPGCAVCTDPLETGSGGACACIPGIQQTCGPNAANYTVVINGEEVSGIYCCAESDPCGWANDGTCDCASECSFDSTDCGGVTQATPICRTPTVGNCGNETWAGRCQGNILVFCDDATDPQRPYVRYGDCAAYPDTPKCGLDDAQGFYTCVMQQSNCGSVPATGSCNGNVAQYCQDGVLKDVDCGGNGCGPFDYEGTSYQFCLPCPQDSHVQGEQCFCNDGFRVNAANDGCEADGSQGSAGDEEGGCACAQPRGGVAWAALLFPLVLAWRRRRS